VLKNVNLDKPVAFFDLETTGTRYYIDRIVEFSVFKLLPDGAPQYKSRRVNPEIPILAGATSKHGITNADVAKEPVFRQLAKSIYEFLEGCDLCGFNILDFDLPLLEHEFDRAGIKFSRENRRIIDTMTLYHSRVPFDPNKPRNLENAYMLYCGKVLQNAHSADDDVKASAEILDGQLEMYDDLPRDLSGLCTVCLSGRINYVDLVGKFVWIDKEASINFGKHKGRKLREMAAEYPDYLSWMIRQDFSPEVKDILQKALKGEFPGR
jgi:DNA polymerase III subunit epsilon